MQHAACWQANTLKDNNMDEKAKKVLSRLENQCARREYCTEDIRQKALKAMDNDEEAAAGIVESLQRDSFVSDLRYASAFAREKASLTGWGPVKIRFALGAKKIDRATIDAAMQEIEPDKADDRLRRLMEQKWKSLQDDPNGKLKLLKFALGRGYSYDQVRKVADDIC